jgi:ferritin-like metal-binding protein YciE
MDIYWAEKALTKAIPKMAKNATSPDLKEALESHLAQTHEQVGRVEMVFEIIGKKATAKKCEAMDGLIKEGEEIMEECEQGPMRDAGIISAGQKIEHYEIASYGTLCQFAETLGFTEAADLLEQTLNEEEDADEKLTEIAVSTVNAEASMAR